MIGKLCLEKVKSVSLAFTRNLSSEVKKKICIVGAGPAGFYAAQYILKYYNDSYVDVIEKLPVPFGLVRFGVAPDHPEVKNVINTFNKTAENPRFKYYGNISLGQDVTLQQLRDHYHAVILAYGAEHDKKFGLENEDLQNVVSARDIVAWYNGLPGAQNLNLDLSCESVTLLGQGNVAIDVARILLSPIPRLEKTDITDFALNALSESKIKEVNLVGRRGPLQAAFTIKELREMLKLAKVGTVWREQDFDGIEELVPSFQRPRKRITELMLKSLKDGPNSDASRWFKPIFFRSPIKFNTSSTKDRVSSIVYAVNKLDNDCAVSTQATEEIPSDLICRSIGYKAVSIDEGITFDHKTGKVGNIAGRVLKKDIDKTGRSIDSFENQFETGLYSTGWLATGPTGVILTTMNNSFAVADLVCKDFENHSIVAAKSKPGFNFKQLRHVSWKAWERINEVEVKRGAEKGKLRAKIVDLNEMLQVAGV